MPVLYHRGKQQIYNQIQNRLEAKILDDELKECERKQIRENQEKMNLEDLKVQRQHAQARKTTALTESHTCLGWRATHTQVFVSPLTGCRLPGPGEEEGGAAATAGGGHAYKCWDHAGQGAEEGGGEAGWHERYGIHQKQTGQLINKQIIDASPRTITNPHSHTVQLNNIQCFLTSAGEGSRVWSRAETNQEGEGAWDCKAKGSAGKSKRLRSRAGQE